MMNQYKNETAQIHAPAALIERTKAAVREEEKRIYRKKHSLRKWTYPLTVAAAVVMLLSVSMVMRGFRSGDGEIVSSSPMMAEESYNDAAGALESSTEEMNGVSQTDRVAAVAAEETESAEETWEGAPAKKPRFVQHGDVRIEAVEERPDFYYHPDAEDAVYEGQNFRMIKEENGWAAYVETEEGEAYVIRGEGDDLDAFLKEGYEGLIKMAESR